MQSDLDFALVISYRLVWIWLRWVAVCVGLDLCDTRIDLVAEGCPVVFQTMRTCSTRVPVVLIELLTGPAILHANPCDVFDGIGFGTIILVVAVSMLRAISIPIRLRLAKPLDPSQHATHCAKWDDLDGLAFIHNGVI